MNLLTGKWGVTFLRERILEIIKVLVFVYSYRCQVGVAASTTITNSPAKKGQVVLVQGNQIGFVGNLLIDEYGIPK